LIDAYFAPLAGLKLRPETELYLGLVHRDDMAGNAGLGNICGRCKTAIPIDR
jgi:hypothetical protein